MLGLKPFLFLITCKLIPEESANKGSNIWRLCMSYSSAACLLSPAAMGKIYANCVCLNKEYITASFWRKNCRKRHVNRSSPIKTFPVRFKENEDNKGGGEGVYSKSSSFCNLLAIRKSRICRPYWKKKKQQQQCTRKSTFDLCDKDAGTKTRELGLRSPLHGPGLVTDFVGVCKQLPFDFQ